MRCNEITDIFKIEIFSMHCYIANTGRNITIKNKKNTTLSEQFQNPIAKTVETNAKSIPLAHTYISTRI